MVMKYKSKNNNHKIAEVRQLIKCKIKEKLKNIIKTTYKNV